MLLSKKIEMMMVILDKTMEDKIQAGEDLIPGQEVLVQVPEAVRTDYGVQQLRAESVYMGVYLGSDEFGNCVIADLQDQRTRVAAPSLVIPMGGKWEN